MDESDARFFARGSRGDSPYAVIESPNASTASLIPSKPRQRAASTSSVGSTATTAASVHLGFPHVESGAMRTPEKHKALAEVFGVVDTEAYQDFGRYTRPKEKRVTQSAGPGRSLRDQRAASVWDIEATLREGVPVGAAPPLPPLPTAYGGSLSPGDDSLSSSTGAPKRSKSLMQRIKKAKRDPNVPMDSYDDIPMAPQSAPAASSGRLRSGTIRRGDISNPIPHESPDDTLARAGYVQQANDPRASVTADMLETLTLGGDENAQPASPSPRIGSNSPPRPLDLPQADEVDAIYDASGLGRKPSLVQRLGIGSRTGNR